MVCLHEDINGEISPATNAWLGRDLERVQFLYVNKMTGTQIATDSRQMAKSEPDTAVGSPGRPILEPTCLRD